MWPWAKRKKREIATVSEDERRAYIHRDPMVWRGMKIGGKVRPEGFLFKNLNDLEAEIAELYGGGSYKAEVFDSKGQTRHGTIRFAIDGEPLREGRPIEPPEEDQPKKRKDDPVSRARAEKDRIEAEKEMKRAAIEAQRELAELSPPEDASLRAELDALKAELAEREAAREKEAREQRLQDKIDRLEEKLSSGGMGNIEQLMRMQGEIFKSTVERIATENKSTIDLIKAMADTKDVKSENLLALMKESMQLGLGMATGNLPDSTPKGPLDIVSSVVDKVGDMVDGFFEAKKGQAIRPEDVKNMTAEAVQQILAEKALPAPTDVGGTTAAAAASAGAAGEPSPAPPQDSMPRAAMNRFLDAILSRARTGSKLSEDWLRKRAQSTLPPKVVGELAANASNPQALLNVVERYGDARKVDAAIRVLREAGFSGTEKDEPKDEPKAEA